MTDPPLVCLEEHGAAWCGDETRTRMRVDMVLPALACGVVMGPEPGVYRVCPECSRIVSLLLTDVGFRREVQKGTPPFEALIKLVTAEGEDFLAVHSLTERNP